MTSPISSAARPRLLELQRATPFQAEPDKGKNLEVAMVATVFKKLQDAGLIRAGAQMSGTVPAAPGLKSTTYEARLRELIKDADGNGQLDLDLTALAGAKMLTRPTTAEELDGLLAGRTAVGAPEAFIKSQSYKSEFVESHRLTSKGAAVESYSRGMVLTTEQDRATSTFLAEAGARARWSPEAAKTVADDAINGALVLTMKGDGRRARALLDGTGQALTEAGRLPEAAEVFTALTRPPHAGVKRNLMQDLVDQMKAADPTFDEKTQTIEDSTGLNTVTVKPSNHASTVGQMAQVRLNQLAVRTQMEATLGRSVDPRNLADAAAFFDTFAKGKPTAQVAEQYQSYLQAFYKHSGDGVEWTSTIPDDERADRLEELFDDQPSDEAGRKIIDCEGFAYLTAHLMGGVKDEAGQQRLQVLYANRPFHIITAVIDPRAKQAFVVSNDQIKPPSAVRSDAEVQRLIGRSLSESGPNIIGIAATPSQSRVRTSDASFAPPMVGALVWNGKQVTGAITAQDQAEYVEATRRAGTIPYEVFAASRR